MASLACVPTRSMLAFCLFASCAIAQSGSKEYERLVNEKARKRTVVREAVPERLVGTPRRELVTSNDGYAYRIASDFETLGKIQEWIVQGQNVDRIAYPGALVWTGPLANHVVDPLRELNGRPPVTVVATKAAGDHRFTHDGTLSDYRARSKDARAALATSNWSTSISMATGRSIHSALLSLGMSAKGWGQRVSTSLDSAQSSSSTFLLIRIDVVMYDLALDTPPPSGFLPSALMDDPQNFANVVPNLEKRGEPGYVSSVRYGRSVLIAASSQDGAESVRKALDMKGGALGFQAKGEVTRERMDAWSNMHVAILVLGGPAESSYVEVLRAGQSKDDLFDKLQKVVQDVGKRSQVSEPAVLSFAVRSCVDDEPFAIEEPFRFTDEAFTASAPRFVDVTLAISTDGNDATRRGSDDEIDTNDNTGIEIAYGTRLLDGGRVVMLDLSWAAQERNRNGSNGNTRFESRKSFTLWTAPSGSSQRALRVESHANARFSGNVRGQRHGFFPFHALDGGPREVGALRNIQLSVDGRGGNDRARQGLRADVTNLRIELAPPPVPQ